MKVIYSVGTSLNGGGIGNTSNFAVKRIYEENLLKKIICLENKQDYIPKDKIIEIKWIKYLIRYPLRFIEKFIFKKFRSYELIDNFYDYLSSRYIEKCDIFHYWRNHGYNSAQIAKKLGARIFVENASSHPLIQKNILEAEYKKNNLNYSAFTDSELKRSIKELEQADKIVVPKGFAYDSFIEKGFPKNKLVPVSFGVDTKKFIPYKNKEKGKFRVLFVGQITLRKGVSYLLKAWEGLNLKNSELILLGNICSDSEFLVKKYKHYKNIKFVQNGKAIDYFKKANLFVFPSLEEGSALVTYEAMACGLPQISTYNSGTVARNGKDGFIIPVRDSQAIREKIKYFYDNPNQINIMGRNARKEVKKYTWEKYGDEIIKAYENYLK